MSNNFNSADIVAFKNVWVFCEQRQGNMMPTSYELISEGRKLADELGVELCGVLLGDDVDGLAKDLGGYGADKVYVFNSPLLKNYTTDGYTKVIADAVEEFKPDQKFLELDDHCLMKMDKEPDQDLYYCPMLDHERGCIMGTEKPFDCRIWPFRIMDLYGTRVIVLSLVCPTVQKRPLCDIQAVAKELAPQIFAYADEHPYAVKKYIHGFPIMLAEEK